MHQKSITNPQFLKYLKINWKENRQVPRKNNKQRGLLINHRGDTETFAKEAKMIFNVLPKDNLDSKNYKIFRNNTNHYIL